MRFLVFLIGCYLTASLSCAPAIGNTSSPPVFHIKVGLFFGTETVAQSAPGIFAAIRRANREHLVDGVNFSYVWRADDCDESKAVVHTLKFAQSDHADVIIGPSCTMSAFISAKIAARFNIPIFPWGQMTATELAYSTQYTTTISVVPNIHLLSTAVFTLFERFEWSHVALLYTPNTEHNKCYYYQRYMEYVLFHGSTTLNIVFKQHFTTDPEGIRKVLNALKARAKVALMCFDRDEDLHNFLVGIGEMRMDENFVFIFTDLRGRGMRYRAFGTEDSSTRGYIWENASEQALNAIALAGTRRIITLDLEDLPQDAAGHYNQEFFAQPPFNCDKGYCFGDPLTERQVSAYARSLHDATYFYTRLVNKTLLMGADLTSVRNGTFLRRICEDQFSGATGSIRMNAAGVREPIFHVTALDANDRPAVFLRILIVGERAVIEENFADEFSSIWATRGGRRPVSRPICGFNASSGDCVLQSFSSTRSFKFLLLGGAALVIAFVLMSIGLACWLRYHIRDHRQLQRKSLIPYAELHGFGETSNGPPKSPHSVTESIVDTLLSSRQHIILDQTNKSKEALLKYASGNHCSLMYRHEVVYAKKLAVNVSISARDMTNLIKLRHFEHDNLNKFLGISNDGPYFLAIWKYCQRGSLMDVLENEKYVSDEFVVLSLLNDVLNGLIAIHHSFMEFHGSLTSKCCLVNDRWQVKLTDFGLRMIERKQPIKNIDYLWMAPELIRTTVNGVLPSGGSRAGDVYSYGIICSELINEQRAWNGIDADEEINETIFLVRKGGSQVHRPTLQPKLDIKTEMLQLIESCWAEDPLKRPKLEVVKKSMRKMASHGNQNLMDYLFAMLETYAQSLQQEVNERLDALAVEKQRSDSLLYRMLPRQVAQKLRTGQTVEPEHFGTATIFFSDIVAFTALAERCTPFQVVDMMNQLFAMLDQLIDKRDAYKVETVGDGYLVCSGLPRRNGDQHAAEIAELSLEFLDGVRQFKIDYLPNESVELRIGFHTGPVVAGVVGLSMPRYCLFGDTVNTASRMESNGKPGKIHITSSANDYVTRIVGGYVTESRGKLNIKGKGIMETFWLMGRDGQVEESAVVHPPQEPHFEEETKRIDEIHEIAIHSVLEKANSETPPNRTVSGKPFGCPIKKRLNSK